MSAPRGAEILKVVLRHGARVLGSLPGQGDDEGPRILCYHGVCADPPDEWSVTPRQLRAHMRLLRAERAPVALHDIVAWLAGGPALPARAVAVTFDDGFRDVLEEAAPLLAEAGVPGAAFLPTALMAGGAADPSFRSARPLMDWAQARTLRRAGWTLGSHARTHPQLRALSAEQALDELRGSREDLEQALGEPVDLLAYPYGTNQTVSPRDQRLAAEAGYRAAFMNMIAPLQVGQTDRLAIPRCKVLRGDSGWVLRGSLSGAMDGWRRIEARG